MHPRVEAEHSKVSQLLRTAQKLLSSFESESTESFVAEVEQYLEALEAWRTNLDEPLFKKLEKEGNSLDALRDAVTELTEAHAEVLKRCEAYREAALGDIDDAHKRAKAMKTYVDRFPKRISITGQRKG